MSEGRAETKLSDEKEIDVTKDAHKKAIQQLYLDQQAAEKLRARPSEDESEEESDDDSDDER